MGSAANLLRGHKTDTGPARNSSFKKALMDGTNSMQVWRYLLSACWCSLLCSLLAWSLCGEAWSQPLGRLKLPRVIIAEGGPYVSRSPSQIQQFRDVITLPPSYAMQPLSLVCTNGADEAMGFQWVRLFLLPGDENASQNGLQGQQLFGRLLVDEHTFLAVPQVYLDMTGQLRPGRNNVAIEAVGVNGATFSWELRSIGTPTLVPANPAVMPGQSFIIYGSGFSSRPEENVVRLGPGYLPVQASNFSEMRVKVPYGWPSGAYDLSVALQNYRSKSIRAEVLKPPQQ